MRIGIVKEGKVPIDKRVPFTPEQCAQLMKNWPGTKVVIQTSDIRAIPDDAYRDAGIDVVEDLSDCDIIMGVKEVPKDQLIPGKTYLFFSHTYKFQPYNRDLLRTILEKKISLIDYELLTNSRGKRVIGFGRYAGIVGCYSGFMGWGKMHNSFELKPAYLCHDRREVNRELKKVVLPNDFRLVLTGKGRVGKGAKEVIAHIPQLKHVEPEAFLSEQFDHPVYTHIDVADYNARKDGKPFKRPDFFANPALYASTFFQYAQKSDMYVACHYWDSEAPFIFTREDAALPDFKIKMVADISCDIDGPVASTLRPSTVEDPLYGYHPGQQKEVPFGTPGSIGVMAVDNLPCELPKDASEDFGEALLEEVIPALLGEDPDNRIDRARETTLDGQLMPDYKYLADWVYAES